MNAANPTPAIFVHIVDDHVMARRSLQWLLDSAQIKTKTWESGQDFLRATTPDDVGVALLDIRMPSMSGIEVFEKLLANGSALMAVFMTGHADVAVAVRAMELGAIGFLIKPYNDEQMLALVRRGCRMSLERYARRCEVARAQRDWEALSEREREIARLLLEEKPNRVIANDLGLSVKTVEGHKARIFLKLQIKSSIGLVRKAELAGIAQPRIQAQAGLDE